MVIKIHESCCSIFNELCFSAALAFARQLIYYTTSSSLCQEVFLNFFQVFSLGSFGTLLSSCLPADFVCCSLTAPVVYHIILPLSRPFAKFFQVFSILFPIRAFRLSYLNLHFPVPIILFSKIPLQTPLIRAIILSVQLTGGYHEAFIRRR